MKNKKLRNICIILLILILFIYVAICVNFYMNGNKMGIFSIRFYIMSSDSPEANIKSGDLVFAKSIKIEDIKENDDIIYKRDDKMIVKKVKQVENINGFTNFYIEDDEMISDEKLENAEIVGKVVSKISGIRKCCIIYTKSNGNIKCIDYNNMYNYNNK